MFAFLSRYPDINTLSVKDYAVELSFDRLKLGVDNLRYDVHISQEFYRVAGDMIFEMVLKHAEVSPAFMRNAEFNWHKEVFGFKRLCTELLIDGVNRAKSLREVQIDFLAQTALVKMLSEEIQRQYDAAIAHFKTIIRKQEISQRIEATLKLREEVGGIVFRKNQILQKVGAELFGYFIDVQHEVNAFRASNFGEEARLPEELFSNPILQTAMQPDGFFMMENYVLLGHRLEDPVNYNTLYNLLTAFLRRMDRGSEDKKVMPPAQIDFAQNRSPMPVKGFVVSYDTRVDGWIQWIDNIDQLFDCFTAEQAWKKLKEQNRDTSKIRAAKKQSALRKKLLKGFFRQVAKENMIDGIVAAYKMKPVFERYCPPLSPQECLQYIVVPKARKNTVRKLKRFTRYYGRSFPLRPLKKTIRQVRSTPRRAQRVLLIRFLKDFAKYHRDLRNFNLIRDASDGINLTTDDKIIKLSRENNTLYEFVLSHEEVIGDKPIINHVVLKADIRGSSAIIEQMKAKGLNPASSFSLNFFEPITKILSQYGAVKVFIEGDAIILSIFEHEGVPGRWYGVARACGLAINILLIIKRYNRKNRENNLPSLEPGIGIGFSDSPPTFFFDDENEIMISPAINIADQLSRCNRALWERLSEENLPFNVYVLAPALDSATSLLFDEGVLRYNVRGIELSPEGFKKLEKEIHLKRVECRIPEVDKETLVLYTEMFPTLDGNFQRLVVREAGIPKVSLKDLSAMGTTDREYYEVCTHPKVYERIKRMLSAPSNE